MERMGSLVCVVSGGGGGVFLGTGGVVGWCVGVPQLWQNLCPGSILAPHSVQKGICYLLDGYVVEFTGYGDGFVNLLKLVYSG